MTSAVLRAVLTHQQLVSWGWRLPFLAGIFVSYFGFYIKRHGVNKCGHRDHQPCPTPAQQENGGSDPVVFDGNGETEVIAAAPYAIPLLKAFSRTNRRSLLAASMVPMLWSAGFSFCFIWMALFMAELTENPVPGAFALSSASLFFSVCLPFPVAGILSDKFGRVRVMTIGGVCLGTISPLLFVFIGRGNPGLAFVSQSVMGISLALYGAPMCAWLVEAFEPGARLTSVAIGYNIAQAIAGGSTPFVATYVVDKVGARAPGWILTVAAVIALTGLLCVAPKLNATNAPKMPAAEATDSTDSMSVEDVEFEMT